LRSFYKPIERKDLEKHAEKYEKVKSSKIEEIKRNREMSIQAEHDHKKALRYQPYRDDTTKKFDPDEHIREEKKKLKERKLNYAK